MLTYNTLAIIPARGGSKGIPKKNLKEINGISLVKRAVDVSSSSSSISHVIVSTDDDEIADSGGSDHGYRRPDDLSGDKVGDLPVLRHALLYAENFFDVTFDCVAMVQPTSPIRTSEDIDLCVKQFKENDFDLVLTVSPTELHAHPYKQFLIESGKVNLFDERGASVIARQELPQLYHRNGVCYVFQREFIISYDLISFENAGFLISSGLRVSIDTLFDLRLCELYLNGEL